VNGMIITQLSTAAMYAAFDLASGAFLWGYVFDTSTSDLACDDATLYCTTGTVTYALALDTGQLRWRADHQQYGFADAFPDLGDDGLVVGNAYIAGFAEGQQLAAIHTATGQVIWQFHIRQQRRCLAPLILAYVYAHRWDRVVDEKRRRYAHRPTWSCLLQSPFN